MDPVQRRYAYARNQGSVPHQIVHFIFKSTQVIVNNPTPKQTKTKVDAFEDTMFLMDLYKHKMQLAKYEKKVRPY